MREYLLKSDFNGIIESLKTSWEIKNSTSSLISNSLIEDTMKFAYDNGALAAKVSGAGGGGFILFLSPPCHNIKLLNKLRERSSETFFCSFSDQGAQSWIMNY